jgi:predicted nucleotide-binding protein
MPEILADSPGRGDTIIEKFERRANDATFAHVLLTPDDVGHAKAAGDLNPRARQNVVLELGYFFGQLGRQNVVVLNAGVEQPSDVNGINYIAYPGQNWKYDLQSRRHWPGHVNLSPLPSRRSVRLFQCARVVH